MYKKNNTEITSIIEKIKRYCILQNRCEFDVIIKRVIPPARKRAEYKPTQKCRDLLKTMISIINWSEKWMPDPEGPRVKVCDCENGEELKLALLPENEAKAAAKNNYNVTYLFD